MRGEEDSVNIRDRENSEVTAPAWCRNLYLSQIGCVYDQFMISSNLPGEVGYGFEHVLIFLYFPIDCKQ